MTCHGGENREGPVSRDMTYSHSLKFAPGNVLPFRTDISRIGFPSRVQHAMVAKGVFSGNVRETQ
jgi:hypothetical protein